MAHFPQELKGCILRGFPVLARNEGREKEPDLGLFCLRDHDPYYQTFRRGIMGFIPSLPQKEMKSYYSFFQNSFRQF